MKNTLELSNEKHLSLLTSTEQDQQPSDTKPEDAPGSFSTILRNVQCLNLVSVSVNVSTNHEEEKHRDPSDESHASTLPIIDTGGRQRSNKDMVEDTGPNGGFVRSFSTLLHSFQIFNLVSVLVNVSTNREEKRPPQPKGTDGKKKVPDFYRDIFGKGGKLDGMGKGVDSAGSRQTTTHLHHSRIPIPFRAQNSDHIEVFAVSASTGFSDIMLKVAELAKTSPNCVSSSANPSSTKALSAESRVTTNSESELKRLKIDVDWDIGEARGRPKRTRLTEENCEAVLLLMERGMVGLWDVKTGVGEETEKDVREEKIVRSEEQKRRSEV